MASVPLRFTSEFRDIGPVVPWHFRGAIPLGFLPVAWKIINGSQWPGIFRPRLMDADGLWAFRGWKNGCFFILNMGPTIRGLSVFFHEPQPSETSHPDLVGTDLAPGWNKGEEFFPFSRRNPNPENLGGGDNMLLQPVGLRYYGMGLLHFYPGKLLHNNGKSSPCLWINQLFLWPFSKANC